MDKNGFGKKGLAVAIILFVIGMSVIPSTGTVVEKKSTMPTFYDGNILYVGGDGSGNYTKIQDAIDNASDGDTVFVYNGVYYENILVDKRISLIGEKNYSTIIDGRQNSHKKSAIQIMTSSVYMCNLTIRNENWHGIEAGYLGMQYTLENSTIFNCRILKTYTGICFWNLSNMLISNCTIFNNIEGVVLVESKYCRIEHCVLSKNLQRGISLNTGSQNNTVIDCKISGTEEHGLYGIDSYGDNNTISHCLITNEGDGIYIDRSKYIRIDNCSIYNNTGSGICIGDGDNNIIENCNIRFNGNNTHSNRYGIHVFEGSYNLITRCNISDNCQGGIKFMSRSQQNTLTKSTIKHNGYTKNGEGILCDSPSNVYLNNFIDNNIQAYDIDSNSEWDNGKYGNFWSDYNGRDWNRDAVGDKPYVIFNNSKDDFPLLCPYNADGPSVLIERPAHFKGDFLYLRNLRILKFSETVLVGNIMVKTRAVNYDNPERITKVKFFVDGVLRHIDIMPPYNWCWQISSPLNHKHIISVIAFDSKGRVGQDSFQAYKFF